MGALSVRDWLCILSPWFALVGLIIWDAREERSGTDQSNVIVKMISCLKSIDSLILAIATIFLAWIAYWQWETLEKADDTSRAVNRAFVAGKTVAISRDLPMYWQFNTIIENTGSTRTRAQNVEVHVYYDFSGDENDRNTEKRTRPVFTPRDDPEELLRKNVGAEFATVDRIPLNSKSTYTIPGSGYLFRSIDQMAEKRADGYISGVITYDDVFNGSKRHISKFCFVIQPVKIGTEPTTVSGGLCQYWNCVDENECTYHKEKYDADVKAITERSAQKK